MEIQASGTFSIAVTVSDSSTPVQTATQTLALTVAPALLTITTSSVPSGAVGSPYSATLTAIGGAAPYHWSATGLPAGLSLNAATGVLTGTPTAAGTFPIAVVLTDSSAPVLTATETLSLTITVPPLSITTTQLPTGTAGSPYSTTLLGAGGTMPYTWSAAGLPAGLSLDPLSGSLTGTPTTVGTSQVSVTLADTSNPRQTATGSYTLAIVQPAAPPVQITPGNSQVTSITTQVGLTVNLAAPASNALTATLALSFTPNASGLPPGTYADPQLLFASGGNTETVTIDAGSASSNSSVIQLGSVAGTITVTLTRLTQTINGSTIDFALPAPNPSTAIVVPRMAPAITSVSFINVTSTGFTLDIVGSSTPRDLASASVTFTAASGTQLNGGSYPSISLTNASDSWFNSTNTASLNAGGAFELQIPFTFSGNTNAIGSVSVTLTNSAGTSAAYSATM